MSAVTWKTKRYIGKDTPLGRVLMEETLPTLPTHEGTGVRLSIPKIPLELFMMIACWQTEIALEHKCESATSLFLVDGQWIAEPLHQENDKESMTIDVDLTPDGINKDILAKYEGKSMVHATLHNHVNGPAGQSGTDVKDEKNLFGPHITIGNLNLAKMSYHGRLSLMIDGKHEFILLHFCDIIETGLGKLTDSMTEKELDSIADAILRLPRMGYKYPDEWKDRFQLKKAKVIPIRNSHHGHTYQQGFSYQDEDWEDGSIPFQKGAHEKVSLLEAVKDAGEFPYAMLSFLDYSAGLEGFEKSIEGSSKIVKEAVTYICLKKKLSLKEMFEILTKEPQQQQT